jgi:hypothetical protein
MAPALLTVATIMTCPHGGMIVSIPGQHQVTASGALVLRRSDTFTVAGCPFAIGPVPSPCVSVTWIVAATRLKVCGDFVLNEASVGLCLGATQAPQGSVLIVWTQQTVHGQ